MPVKKKKRKRKEKPNHELVNLALQKTNAKEKSKRGRPKKPRLDPLSRIVSTYSERDHAAEEHRKGVDKDEISKDAITEPPPTGPFREHKEPLDRSLPYMLGRHPDYDERSKEHTVTQFLLPESDINHVVEGNVLNQGSTGSCVGHSAAHALNAGPLRQSLARKNLELRTDADARNYYSMATVLDGFLGTFPPDDSGSSTLAVSKALKKLGLITRYEAIFSAAGVLGTLTFGPLIIGVPWYENFFFPDKHGLITIKGRIAGGHAVAVVGYKVVGKKLENNLIKCRNSWGKQWGVKGDFFMTVKTLDKLLSLQGDAYRLVA